MTNGEYYSKKFEEFHTHKKLQIAIISAILSVVMVVLTCSINIVFFAFVLLFGSIAMTLFFVCFEEWLESEHKE